MRWILGSGWTLTHSIKKSPIKKLRCDLIVGHTYILHAWSTGLKTKQNVEFAFSGQSPPLIIALLTTRDFSKTQKNLEFEKLFLPFIGPRWTAGHQKLFPAFAKTWDPRHLYPGPFALKKCLWWHADHFCTSVKKFLHLNPNLSINSSPSCLFVG